MDPTPNIEEWYSWDEQEERSFGTTSGTLASIEKFGIRNTQQLEATERCQH
jgi:hypothetical protein